MVIIGGWAQRLYRLHPAAGTVDYPPVITLDTDVAVPAALQLKEENIRERLVANGFQEEFLGDQRPPATHYRLGDSKSGFYAEFLTPLLGGEYDRRGSRKATVSIGGVTLQKLRHLHLLLLDPWQVDIDQSNGFPTPQPRRIQVANPVSFLAQKILIHPKRQSEDRANDILYIHDTLEVFSSHIDELHELWRGTLRPTLSSKSIRVVEAAAETLFAQVDDTIRESAQTAIGRTLSAELIREVCHLGLSRLFR